MLVSAHPQRASQEGVPGDMIWDDFEDSNTSSRSFQQLRRLKVRYFAVLMVRWASHLRGVMPRRLEHLRKALLVHGTSFLRWCCWAVDIGMVPPL
jgi:hypothetical protein